MATFAWEAFKGTTPSWEAIAGTVVFSGSGGLATPITVGTWQDETHDGTADPGTDQCGTNHIVNNKYVSSTQFDNGSGTETLNDTNLTNDECTIRIEFTDASSVTTSNARFYTFDASTTTVEAVDIEAYAFEAQQAATTWDQVNDDSGNIGGDNTGERLELADQSTGTEHWFYIAISARPESVGSKTEFDFGVALTYS